MLAVATGALNSTCIWAFMGTEVCPFTGLLRVTVGGVVDGWNVVVKAKVPGFRRLPARSCTLLPQFRVNERPTAKAVTGANDAVRALLLSVQTPATGKVVMRSTTGRLALVMVAGSTGLSNCKVMAELIGTPMASLAGW